MEEKREEIIKSLEENTMMLNDLLGIRLRSIHNKLEVTEDKECIKLATITIQCTRLYYDFIANYLDI